MAKKIEINNETNELNYLFGGYFSGCGHVNLYKVKKYEESYSFKGNVAFDDLKIAKLFQQNFGGIIREESRTPPFWNENNKVNKIWKKFSWYIDGVMLKDFIVIIKPYVINKRLLKRFEILEKFIGCQLKNKNQKSERYRKQKHKYYLRMRRLR